MTPTTNRGMSFSNPVAGWTTFFNWCGGPLGFEVPKDYNTPIRDLDPMRTSVLLISGYQGVGS